MSEYSFKELKKEMIARLKLGLAGYGFAYKGNGMDFERRLPDVRWSFRVGWVKHHSDFDIIASVSVGLDALENLIRDIPTGSPSGYSMGGELGNISEGKQKRWSVRAHEDIEPSSKSLLESFAAVGLPYLEKYSIMENALEVLSGDDRAAWLHCAVHDARATRALGLAFLLRDKEAFRRLAAQKTEFLTNRNDPMLQRFLDFRLKLENHPM